MLTPSQKQDIVLGIGLTFVFLDVGWFIFYYGLLRKVTARDVPGVKKYVRIGCYFRALQELFNTSVMFALIRVFSLRKDSIYFASEKVWILSKNWGLGNPRPDFEGLIWGRWGMSMEARLFMRNIRRIINGILPKHRPQ